MGDGSDCRSLAGGGGIASLVAGDGHSVFITGVIVTAVIGVVAIAEVESKLTGRGGGGGLRFEGGPG